MKTKLSVLLRLINKTGKKKISGIFEKQIVLKNAIINKIKRSRGGNLRNRRK